MTPPDALPASKEAEAEPFAWRADIYGNAVYSTNPYDGKRWLENPNFKCMPLFARSAQLHKLHHRQPQTRLLSD